MIDIRKTLESFLNGEDPFPPGPAGEIIKVPLRGSNNFDRMCLEEFGKIYGWKYIDVEYIISDQAEIYDIFKRRPKQGYLLKDTSVCVLGNVCCRFKIIPKTMPDAEHMWGLCVACKASVYLRDRLCCLIDDPEARAQVLAGEGFIGSRMGVI